MDGPTREEYDAKLAAAEARTEARFVELNGKIDRVADSIIALGAAMRTEIGTIRNEVGTLRAEVGTLRTDVGTLRTEVGTLRTEVGTLRTESTTLRTAVADLRSDNKYTRWTIVITVVASALAAIAALWVTQANLLAAFSAGLALRTETRQAPPPAPMPPQTPAAGSH